MGLMIYFTDQNPWLILRAGNFSREKKNPVASMYGIFTYIYHTFTMKKQPNVGTFVPWIWVCSSHKSWVINPVYLKVDGFLFDEIFLSIVWGGDFQFFS